LEAPEKFESAVMQTFANSKQDNEKTCRRRSHRSKIGATEMRLTYDPVKGTT
jgi:hypothetical protein